MKIIKNKDHYLLKNDKGEYHLSLEEFNQLGEHEAIKLAESEIDKKLKASYQDAEIDFKRARSLGFCEYGIEDFCGQLDLDINNTYSISLLKDKLTLEVFLEYPDECLKLFGKELFNKFGGAKALLAENRTRKVFNLVLKHAVEDKVVHKLACEFALRCIDNYEKEYPNDSRPRKAIEAKLKWIDGEISGEELDLAARSAYSAAESAATSAWSAARSAESAAESAARSARSASSAAWSAASSAAWSAARSAATSAWSATWSAWSAAESAAESAARSARSAELEWQIERTLKEF